MRIAIRLIPAALLAGSYAAAACTGAVSPSEENDGPGSEDDGSGGDGGTSAGGSGGKTPTPKPEDIPAVKRMGDTPLLRLGALEYRNTIRDAFPEAGSVVQSGDLPVDESVAGFAGQATKALDVESLDRYVKVAETVAQALSAKADALLAECRKSGDEPSCVRSFFAARLPKLWRRELRDGELDALLRATFEPVRKSEDLTLAFESVVLRVLLDAEFLYRIERGAPVAAAGPDVWMLDDTALAQRLSYFLWNSAPDDKLRAAARDGKLRTADRLLAETRRLLDDPRGAEMLRDFTAQWLHFDEAKFPGKSAYGMDWSATLRKEMFEETDRFLDHVVRGNDARWGDLFAATYTFATPALAKLYGAQGGSASFDRVTFGANLDRAGLLTHASFLTHHSHFEDPRQAIHRGLYVRTQFLCQPVPAPENVDTTAQVDRLARGNGCSACHLQFENIGQGFEGFDGLGRQRTTAGGKPISPRGEVKGLDGQDHTFTSARQLGELLAKSRDARACVAKQWFRYGFGREEASGELEDESALEEAASELETSGSVRKMIERLVSSAGFRHRREQPNVGCTM